jgi:hypothetical protein
MSADLTKQLLATAALGVCSAIDRLICPTGEAL